jgi:prepilin-type N-terminal cleavage/methylation domain-containing protein
MKRAHSKGFTLVEMIVAIALFTVVALVAIGALLRIVDANKRAQSIKNSVNNMNFALEAMTRELRVGTRYNCISGVGTLPTSLSASQGCALTSGSWTIAFNSSKVKDNGGTKCNLVHVYQFDGVSLKKGEQRDCGQTYNTYPIIYGGTDSSADETAVQFEKGTIKVVVSGTAQPLAQFHFVGSAGIKEKHKSYFDLQTSVSQRLPN